MYLKLQQRELLNEKKDNYNKTEIHIHGPGTVKLHISANEPTDDILVKISESAKEPDTETKWYEGVEAVEEDRSVNVLEIYHQLYG
jgi:hypothetical protein